MDTDALTGRELGTSEWLEVTQERIDAFAEITGDYQWIHVDPDRAAAGPFGTTIAHGYLMLSLLPYLTSAIRPRLEGVRMGLNYGLDRVRFTSPVPVGSRIRARARVLEARNVEGGVHVKTEVTVELEGSEKPACVAETLTRFLVG